MAKALHIPADWQKPVEVFDLPDSEIDSEKTVEELRRRIFPADIEYQSKVFSIGGWGRRPDGVHLLSYFDDEGLYNTPNMINIRACALYLAVNRLPLHRMSTPLVGEYVIVAINSDTGEDVDVPEGIILDVKELFTSPWVQVTDLEGNPL